MIKIRTNASKIIHVYYALLDLKYYTFHTSLQY